MQGAKSGSALHLEQMPAAASKSLSTEPATAKKEPTMNKTSSGSFSNNQLSETTAEERMNQTAQSFRSTSSQFNQSRLGEGGG